MDYDFDRKGGSENNYNNMIFAYIILTPHLKRKVFGNFNFEWEQDT